MNPTPSFPDIQLIVFDLDGTLVDTFQDIAAAANHALEQTGRPPLPIPEITKHVGGGGNSLMAGLLGADAREGEIDQAFAAWGAYYRRHPADHAAPYPGVLETLQILKERQIRLAVLSNKLDELVQRILDQLNLAPFFHAIQGEIPNAPRKPDPAPLLDIMQKAAARPDQTLMVGDGDADILVALNAQVAPIGVSYGVHTSEELLTLGAVAVLDAIAQLPDLLR